MLRSILATTMALAWLWVSPATAQGPELPEPPPSEWMAQADLFGALAYIPPQRNDEVIAWTRRYADQLSPGFLFDLSRRVLPSDPDEALEWYSLATMRGLYDAGRCLDATAQRAVRGLARQAAVVARYGQAHPEQFAAAGERMLARPDLFAHQVPADWICAQGLTGMGGKSAGTIAPARWPAVADSVRADFARQFEQMSKR